MPRLTCHRWAHRRPSSRGSGSRQSPDSPLAGIRQHTCFPTGVPATRARAGRSGAAPAPTAPLKFWTVLHEAVLYQQFAVRRETMRNQLRHLWDVSELPNIIMQIMPLAATSHPGGADDFNLVGFPGLMPDVVLLENISGATCVEDFDKVQVFADAFEHIVAAALPVDNSMALITRIEEESRRCEGVRGRAVRRGSLCREVAQGFRERRREQRRRGRRTAARAVQDSKNPDREPLRFTASEWVAFRAGVIAGEL
ncbi:MULTISPECIES: DUF397 domain-containing protein [unclassified Streptomyces]|uniref:DUF397 domain-containing protein n=1 Tax=unclassified Streptomyces TaxID=2593676 RepID=UPI003804714A